MVVDLVAAAYPTERIFHGWPMDFAGLRALQRYAQKPAAKYRRAANPRPDAGDRL